MDTSLLSTIWYFQGNCFKISRFLKYLATYFFISLGGWGWCLGCERISKQKQLCVVLMVLQTPLCNRHVPSEKKKFKMNKRERCKVPAHWTNEFSQIYYRGKTNNTVCTTSNCSLLRGEHSKILETIHSPFPGRLLCAMIWRGYIWSSEEGEY